MEASFEGQFNHGKGSVVAEVNEQPGFSLSNSNLRLGTTADFPKFRVFSGSILIFWVYTYLWKVPHALQLQQQTYACAFLAQDRASLKEMDLASICTCSDYYGVGVLLKSIDPAARPSIF